MSRDSRNARRRPTLRDVAAQADVSIQTVSNVTRGRFDLMGRDTRLRVEAAMVELGYHPNLTARGLREARTHTLGFLVLDQAPSFLADPLTALIMAGLGDVARDLGYGVLVRAERPLDGHQALLKPLHEGRVDGAAVLMSGDPDLRAKYVRNLVALDLPFVIFDELLNDRSVLSVRTAERDSSRNLVEHLLGQGHTRIAFTAARLPWAVIEQRFLGYQDALRSAGIEPNPALQLFEATWQAEGGRLMAEKLIALPEPPSAIVCGSDVLAIGAISAAKAHNLRIPDDIAICGFDDFEFSAYVDPPLTTVRIPGYVMGRTAAGTLIDLIAGNEPPNRQVVLQNEVVIRESA